MKTYLISFGNSEKYKIQYPGSKEELASDSKVGVKEVADHLKTCLLSKFPGVDALSNFYTPTIEEVPASEADGYTPFDEDAQKKICNLLHTEVENMEFQKGLSADAPFNDVPPNTQIG